jgi:hypothetical protein
MVELESVGKGESSFRLSDAQTPHMMVELESVGKGESFFRLSRAETPLQMAELDGRKRGQKLHQAVSCVSGTACVEDFDA